MHLHALRLSDLCTAGGRQNTDHSMEVQLDPPILLAPITSPDFLWLPIMEIGPPDNVLLLNGLSDIASAIAPILGRSPADLAKFGTTRKAKT
jgi:hypothetical protein